jgi:hypothetical protein
MTFSVQWQGRFKIVELPCPCPYTPPPHPESERVSPAVFNSDEDNLDTLPLNRISLFDVVSGALVRVIGASGSGPGQLFAPTGLR